MRIVLQWPEIETPALEDKRERCRRRIAPPVQKFQVYADAYFAALMVLQTDVMLNLI